jgi:Ser/Thr protein kinase RdoA (MazF antagonist)
MAALTDIKWMTSSDMSLRHEALSLILSEEEAKNAIITPTTGGVNNIMDYITTASGKKYVLRIYNNGRDSVRVDFEDRVLSALIKNGGELSFKVPTAIPSVIDGRSHVLLKNGAEAILFEFIPGELPKKTRVKEIGRASGELVAALGKVSVDIKSPNPRFCELYKAHHATTREIFFDELKKPCFDISPDVRKYTDLLRDEVLEIEKKIGWLNI